MGEGGDGNNGNNKAPRLVVCGGMLEEVEQFCYIVLRTRGRVQ